MTSQTVTPETISRYLADRLSDGERADFEALCVRHPQIVRDMEETLRFREGLAVLRDRGLLAELLRVKRRLRPPLLWALAATFAAVAVATTLWLRAPHAASPLLAAMPASTPSLGEVYSFVTTRGRADAVAIATGPAARQSEFRLLPDAKSPGGRYRVDLEQLLPDGRAVVVASVEHAAAGSDGFVVVYASLPGRTGRHLLAIRPEPATATAPVTRFAIELVAAAKQ